MAWMLTTVLYCFCLVSIRISQGYNLDYQFPIIKTGPPGSFFGFSVAEHQYSEAGSSVLKNRFLVGAPNGQNKFQKTLTRPGTVYSCDAGTTNFTCDDQVPFDTLGNSDPKTEDKNNQWFGVSLKSAGPNKPVISCANKYLYKTTAGNYHLYEGTCHTATGRLDTEETYTPCRQENDDLAKSATAPSYKNSGQCLSGIGVDIIETGSQRDYIIGSVGYALQQGAIYQMAEKQDENTPQTLVSKVTKNDQGLIGFSVDHGHFLDKGRIDIASGAPRADSVGMVFIFSKEKKVNETLPSLKIKLTLPYDDDKVQLSCSYGFAVTAVDADKDGFTELLVGAPYHAGEDFPGQGMVYYYKQNAKGKLVLTHRLFAKGNRLNFGSAIVNAGDLDLNGYDDIVIGAPYEEDGRGAVYVYQGSAKGLGSKFSQRILASAINPNLKGFGRSLAGGLDLDSNGYKDVLVGAYTSDSVVLLRGRPIIKVITEYVYLGGNVITEIFPPGSSRRIRFRLCYKYEDITGRITAPQVLQFKIVADTGIVPRLAFKRSAGSSETITTTVERTRRCQMMNMLFDYSKSSTIQVYPDVPLITTWRVPGGDRQLPPIVPGVVTSIDSHSLFMDENKATYPKSGILKFKRDCGPCIADLAIAAKNNQTISLGTDSLSLNVSVINNGRDPAFAVAIWVHLTKGLALTDLVVGERRVVCENAVEQSDMSLRYRCNNVFHQLENKTAAMMTLVLDTKSLSPYSSNIKVKVNISSANLETGTTADNFLVSAISIKASADPALSGTLRTRQEFYGGEIKGESAMTFDTDIGLVVRHRYYLLNYGPDLLPSAIITVHWPSEAVSGKHLLYLTNVDAENAVCKIKKGIVNERGYKLSISNATKLVLNQNINLRVRKSAETDEDPDASSEAKAESITEPADSGATGSTGSSGGKPGSIGDGSKLPAKGARGEKGGMEGKILDCRKGTARCVSFTCEAKNLAKGDNAYITLTSRIWNATFLMDYKGDILTVVSYANVKIASNVSYIKDEDLKNNDAELFTVIRPDFPTKRAEKIAVWKIALAVLAGVILLALLIFGLYKVGFFNRRSSSQMRKKKEVDGADDTLLGGAKK